jgi:hypothetical protein
MIPTAEELASRPDQAPTLAAPPSAAVTVDFPPVASSPESRASPLNSAACFSTAAVLIRRLSSTRAGPLSVGFARRRNSFWNVHHIGASIPPHESPPQTLFPNSVL